MFEKQLKRLSKKYPSLKEEFLQLIKNIHKDPFQGKAIGHNCFKIRIAIASKGKGKSGGARVVTNIVVSDTAIYLLAIYDKSERESLSNTELAELLKQIP